MTWGWARRCRLTAHKHRRTAAPRRTTPHHATPHAMREERTNTGRQAGGQMEAHVGSPAMPSCLRLCCLACSPLPRNGGKALFRIQHVARRCLPCVERERSRACSCRVAAVVESDAEIPFLHPWFLPRKLARCPRDDHITPSNSFESTSCPGSRSCSRSAPTARCDLRS